MVTGPSPASSALEPPPGITLGIRAPGLSTVASAGYRTVHWRDGRRRGIDRLTPETHHDMASVTKVVGTTACLLRLVSDGLVDLDAAVNRYLPGFRGAGREKVTLRDLLLHRGGLKEWYPLYIASQDIDEAHRLVESLPLVCAPGTARRYSDLGFMLLGRVISAATGLGVAAATAELVTGPLGLRSTRFASPAGSNVATSARDDRIEAAMIDSQNPYPVPFDSNAFPRWRRQPVHGQVADGNAYHVFEGVAGHAGLFSTIPDLLQFASALAAYREHDSLWRPEVAEKFFANGPDPGQALGFRRYRLKVANETMTVLGHPGHVGCAVGFVPNRGIALALASNRLLVNGQPVPTEELWAEFLNLAGDQLGRSSL
ncbi:serine hydrolase domain-containing protein [Arthrobacter sulfonylureivorans]|uniref:serine hydrolase domain-containing protein n=1 Tax=Arthrobacter sulfonylureivorans TaxID=2486855 RepID=UPI0039E2903F